jgi:alpha-1,2-mannosyltransferase
VRAVRADWIAGRGRPVRGLLILGGGAVCVGYLLHAWRGFELDLAVYRAGGAAALRGHHLYNGLETGSGYPFTYPPVSALLFSPLSPLPQGLAQLVWTITSLVGLWFVVRLTLDRYASSAVAADPNWRLAVFVLVAVSDPLRVGLGTGQINVFIALLVLADLCGVWPRLPRGVLIGVAGAVKLTPLFLIAYLLAVRRIRDAGWAAGTFLCITAATFVVMPTASADFWFGDVSDLSRFGLGYVSNQSVNGLIVRWQHYPVHDRGLWLCCALLVAVMVLWTARNVVRSRPWLAEGVAMGGMLAVSPVSWIHHWIFVLPLLVASVRLGTDRRYRQIRWLAVALGAVLLGRVAWLMVNTYRDSPAEFLLGNIDILLLLTLLASIAWTFRTAPREPATALGDDSPTRFGTGR